MGQTVTRVVPTWPRKGPRRRGTYCPLFNTVLTLLGFADGLTALLIQLGRWLHIVSRPETFIHHLIHISSRLAPSVAKRPRLAGNESVPRLAGKCGESEFLSLDFVHHSSVFFVSGRDLRQW